MIKPLTLLLVTTLSIADAQGVRRCSSTVPTCCETERFCVFWSQNGECQRNAAWMLENCKVSCNVCGGGAPPTFPTTPRPTRPTPARDPQAPEGCTSVTTTEVMFAPQLSINQFLGGAGRSACGQTTSMRDCNSNICFHKKFRSFDGVCNNLNSHLKGAAFTPNPRMLPNDYDDGIGAVTDSLKRRRPNPRAVSALLLASNQAIPLNVSSMLMQFGQFLSHDITQNGLLPQPCGCGTAHPLCVTIPQSFDGSNLPCIGYVRSLPQCGTGFPGRPREQMNANTAFIDGSGIYSSDSTSGRNLRFGALLRLTTINGRPHFANEGVLGDGRNNLISGVAAVQTIFMRLHNRIATQLTTLNPRWNQDRVYHEARKIVGASIQNIVYQEFLPALLGPVAIRKISNINGYNPNADPSILNEFAGAAYRIHGLIHEGYPLLDQNFREVGRYSFSQAINDSPRFAKSHLDHLIRGLIATPSRAPQRLSTTVAVSGFRLAVLSLQRGRDQGLQTYNEYRKLCGLSSISNFDNWPEVRDPQVVARVKQLYPGGVDTLDLYVGGLLEEPVNGAIMGPTFTCIITEQFKRLKEGDRFFYENREVFTNEQLVAIRRVTLSWILCTNGDNLSHITARAFFTDRGTNALPCSSLQSLDLTAWREN